MFDMNYSVGLNEPSLWVLGSIFPDLGLGLTIFLATKLVRNSRFFSFEGVLVASKFDFGS